MGKVLCPAEAQMARLQPFFPKCHGKPRVDDRRVVGGIPFINRSGSRLREKAHRIATGLRSKKSGEATRWSSARPHERRHENGPSAVADAHGRPIPFLMTGGQPGHRSRRGLVQEAVKDKGKRACSPGREVAWRVRRHDRRGYKRPDRIEIMSACPMERQRIATRQDRCPRVFLSAVARAETALF